MPDLRDQVMPYLELDDFGCERVPSNASVLVLENDHLRAAITPSYGGKVWSLYDKKHDKQLVYNNPAHQPSSIALRQAWTAGGIEWNWAPGRIGHSVFSEQAVFAAKIPTPRGDVARVWEFDRQNHTVWQVDIFLEDDVLWAHPTITNPNDEDLRGYLAKPPVILSPSRSTDLFGGAGTGGRASGCASRPRRESSSPRSAGSAPARSGRTYSAKYFS